jgi:hypothetical protein
MQSYADCWRALPCGSPSTSHVANRISGSTHQLSVPEIPFQASSLPLLSRSRIGSPKPPSTPPKRKPQPVFTPRSTPLDLKKLETPISVPSPASPTLEISLQALTPPPTPIPFSRFSQAPSTPGLSSGSSSCTPTRYQSRLLTPVTPTHIRYDERGLPVDYLSPAYPGPIPDQVISPWSNISGSQGRSTQKIPQTPMPTTHSMPFRTLYPPIQAVAQSLPDVMYAKPKMLHHISSDGGPVAAMKRYPIASRKDETISGMSLFLHCPKKRVPHYSMDRVRREGEIAVEWNKLLKLSSESVTGS